MRKKTKFLALRVSIMLAFAILAGRLWYVQVVMGSYYQAQGDTSKIRLVPVQALRGIIYDRKGRQLVWNAPSWQIEIVPHGVPAGRQSQIFGIVAHLLGGHPGERKIAALVRAGSWHPYTGTVIKADVATQTAMVIKQLHAQLPGVRVVLSSVRAYRQDPGSAISHLLGYTTVIPSATYHVYRRQYPHLNVDPTDQTGSDGVESAADAYLHGVNGREQVEVDAGERPVRVLQPGHSIPGDDIYLTINWKLQRAVSRDLTAALAHLGLRQGVAILENVHNGQILAMSSVPSYNGNQFSGGISEKAYAALLHDPATPLNNLATQGQYAPGSTYKLITAAAALQTGVVDANTIVDDGGQIQPCATCIVYHGWKAGGLGPENVVGAIAQSSDIYFYTVTGGDPVDYPGRPYIGGGRLGYWARQFGLGTPTGIELPNEASGFVPTPKWFNSLKPGVLKNPGDRWTIGYNYNSAIGQGFDLATPLQMVNVAATIANGGTLYQPRIIQRVVGRVEPNGTVLKHRKVIEPFVPHPLRRDFVSPDTLALIREGMHESVDLPGYEGTSYAVRDSRIDAAGKTGTAEDNPHPPHAWWLGYAPFNNPQVAIVVMVPNANSEGAYTAAPIAHKLLEDYFHLKAKANWLDDVTQQLVGGATQ